MFLLDTNVVAELRKARAGEADPQVVVWAASASAATMFVSVITIQELDLPGPGSAAVLLLSARKFWHHRQASRPRERAYRLSSLAAVAMCASGRIAGATLYGPDGLLLVSGIRRAQ